MYRWLFGYFWSNVCIGVPPMHFTQTAYDYYTFIERYFKNILEPHAEPIYKHKNAMINPKFIHSVGKLVGEFCPMRDVYRNKNQKLGTEYTIYESPHW